MPPTPTANPDGAKIRELIRQWAQARELKAEVTSFARKIGRPRQSVQNIISLQVPTSKPFIRQIARELGVKPGDISDWAGDDDIESDAVTKVPAA